MRYIIGFLSVVIFLGVMGCDNFHDRDRDRNRYDRYDRDRDRDHDRYDRYDRNRYDRYDRDRYDRNRYDRYDRDRDRDRYDRYDRRSEYHIDLLQRHNKTRSTYLSGSNPASFSRYDLNIILDLELAAQAQAEWMANNRQLSHEGLGKGVEDRVKSRKWNYLGENIAFGYKNETEVMRAWMNSQDHKSNILSRHYTHIGFGAARAKDGTLYWCAVFGG